jgi:hypothetical protein
MKAKYIKERITDAFKRSDFKWRTAKGLSKDSNVPYQNVIEFLETSDNVIKAKKLNKRGQPLYSLKEIYENKTSFTTKLFDAITNKISD